MTSIRRGLTVAALFAVFAAHAEEGRQQVPIDKVAQFEGREVTVCGSIDSTRHSPNVQGEPTLLHMGGAFPRHRFAVRVWGQDRGKFDHDLEALQGRQACVSGRVRMVNRRPEMVLSSPRDLAVF